MSNSVNSLSAYSLKNEENSSSTKQRFSNFLLATTLVPLLLTNGYAAADNFSFSNTTITTDIDLEEGTDSLTLNNVTLNANVNAGTDATDTVTVTGSTVNSITFDLETGINVLTLNNSTMTNAGTTLTLDGSAAGDDQTLTLENGSSFNNGTLVFNVGAGSTGTLNINNSAMTLGGNLAPGNGSLITNVTNSGTLNLGANNITGGTADDQLNLSDGGAVTAGTVDFSSGDNTVSITGTSTLTGNLTLGSGENTLTFGGTGTKVSGAITLAGTDNILILNDLSGAQNSIAAIDFTTVKSLTLDAGTAFDPNGASTSLGSGGEDLVFTLQNGAGFSNNLTFAGGATSSTINISGGSTLTGNLNGSNNTDTVTIVGSSTVTGNVNLGTGDDNLTLTASTINGNANLGSGNNATIQITDDSDITGTLSTQSAVNDDLDITGSTVGGLITLNGAGTKDIDLSGATLTAGFDIDGIGNVEISSSGDTFNGNIDLSGTSGTNTLALTDSNVNASMTLGTGNDTLTLQNTSVTGTITAGAGDTDNLILNGTGTIGSAFNQFENFTMNGTAWTLNNALSLEGGGTATFSSGTFTVSAGNTFTTTNSVATVDSGATLSLAGNLNAGNAAVNNNGTINFSGGTLTSTGLINLNDTVNIGTGGTISGDGTDGNPVTFSGTIAGSDSSTILTINDDLTFNSGSTIVTTVSTGGAASRINVNGAGAVVNDTAGGIAIIVQDDGSGNPADGDTFTILNSANGGINSTNYTVTENLTFIDFDLNSSSANSLILTANKEAYATAANNNASRRVAKALDNGTVSSDLAASLNSISIATASDLFSSQSGLVTTSTMNAVNTASDKITNIVRNRTSRIGGASLASLSEDGVVIASSNAVPVRSAVGREYWIEGAIGFGSVDSDENAQGSNHRSFGTAFGVEQTFSPATSGGLFGAVSYTSSDIDGLNDDGNSIVFRGGLYGARDLSGGWHINGSVSGAYIHYDTSRSTVSGKADADFGGFGAFANTEVAYDYKMKSLSGVVSPYVGLDASIIHHEDYDESGAGALNMSVESSTTEKLTSELGVQYTGKQVGMTFTNSLVARVGWAHEFLDQTADQSSRFISSPTVSFTSNGPEVARNSAKIGLAYSAKPNNADYLFYAKYDGEFSADLQDHLFSAGLKFKW